MADPAPFSPQPESFQGATTPTRERSTIQFPYDDLNSGIGVAQAVHERGDKCAMDELAAQLKYSSVENGAFRLRVATARHFGLIGVSRDGVTLTTLGREIVDPSRSARAKAEAFLAVPLYKAVYEEFRGHLLPPAAGLERKFVELGVAPKQTDKARQAFQRSADQAGYFAQGRDRLVRPITAGAKEVFATPEDGGNGGDSGGGEEKTIQLHGGGRLTLRASVNFFKMPKSDRDFVFHLIDQLSEYEERKLLSAPQPQATPTQEREADDALLKQLEIGELA